jgi:1-acyl-sn-glycerol-3-phosphate acyltransferase
LALPVLFGLKVENRSVLRQRRREGYVLVCNHVHPMDCTFLGVAAFPRNAIFTSQEETFYIRGLGTLLRLLNCVPVLSGIKGLRTFLEEMEHQLRKGRVVVVYPEGEIHVCCDHLRKFSDGAFTMATRGDVPVIPAVITPREATGFWKKIGRTYCVTLTIGQPIAPTTEGTEKQRIRRLREDTIDAMETMLEQGGHAYPKEDVNDKDAFWQVKKSKGLKK